MSHEEFVQKWTDSFKRNPAVWQFPAGMQELLVGIFHLLKFAKDMREIYQKTCRGEDGIEFHYPINLRDNIQIVYEFERGGRTFKEAVSNVLMPKISGKPIDLNVEEEKSLLKTKLDEYFK